MVAIEEIIPQEAYHAIYAKSFAKDSRHKNFNFTCIDSDGVNEKPKQLQTKAKSNRIVQLHYISLFYREKKRTLYCSKYTRSRALYFLYHVSFRMCLVSSSRCQNVCTFASTQQFSCLIWLFKCWFSPNIFEWNIFLSNIVCLISKHTILGQYSVLRILFKIKQTIYSVLSKG